MNEYVSVQQYIMNVFPHFQLFPNVVYTESTLHGWNAPTTKWYMNKNAWKMHHSQSTLIYEFIGFRFKEILLQASSFEQKAFSK